MKPQPTDTAAVLYDIYLRAFVLAKLGRELPNTAFLYRQDVPLSQAELLAVALGADDASTSGSLLGREALLARIEALLGAPAGEPMALVA
ncbi:MAG: hypothetical protein RMK29_09585 [Myxococcales bacterium]|nr:hypothetical protein [Myxococcota bacterium]MDW8281952.1 hypothetical protein [Myxococcales bacterium]